MNVSGNYFPNKIKDTFFILGKSNMKELEEGSKKAAIAHIITMFQRPGQLEKVEQYKRRFTRKKASVEALLKSAMQQQLDGVRVGLNELHSCLETVKEVDESVKKMTNLFNDVVNLSSSLNEVREENMRHSQYVTARENLKYIFTVPDSVEKTKQWINEGKLLHTHQVRFPHPPINVQLVLLVIFFFLVSS